MHEEPPLRPARLVLMDPVSFVAGDGGPFVSTQTTVAKRRFVARKRPCPVRPRVGARPQLQPVRPTAETSPPFPRPFLDRSWNLPAGAAQVCFLHESAESHRPHSTVGEAGGGVASSAAHLFDGVGCLSGRSARRCARLERGGAGRCSCCCCCSSYETRATRRSPSAPSCPARRRDDSRDAAEMRTRCGLFLDTLPDTSMTRH